jgi:hypothetical protein
MSDADIAVRIANSGSPDYVASPQESPRWPSGSVLLSTLVSSVPAVSLTPRCETVFLTRSQQRTMNRALRDSLRIIA